MSYHMQRKTYFISFSLVREIVRKSSSTFVHRLRVRSSILSKLPNDHVSKFWDYYAFSNVKLTHGKPLLVAKFLDSSLRTNI